MKIKQIKPDKKLRIDRKAKVIIFIIALILIIALANKGLQEVNVWFATHYLQFNKVVNIELKKPIEIRERKVETQEIVRIIETIPAPEDLETDIEKKIYELWGIENYRFAISVAMAESNMNCNALHINDNGSADFSIFQVNSLWIKNYSLAELADCDRNIEIAQEIWDNGNGILGDNKGSWSPWTVTKTGAYLKFLQ